MILPDKPEFYTPMEVGKLLRVSKGAIYGYINEGKLSTVKFGNRATRITRQALQDFINASHVI